MTEAFIYFLYIYIVLDIKIQFAINLAIINNFEYFGIMLIVTLVNFIHYDRIAISSINILQWIYLVIAFKFYKCYFAVS